MLVYFHNLSDKLIIFKTNFEIYLSIGYAPSPYEQQAPPGQPVMPLPPPGAQPTPSYAPPPFLVPPPQFIASQTAPPSIINYVPGPNGPIFQPNYQSYNPAPVS